MENENLFTCPCGEYIFDYKKQEFYFSTRKVKEIKDAESKPETEEEKTARLEREAEEKRKRDKKENGEGIGIF